MSVSDQATSGETMSVTTTPDESTTSTETHGVIMTEAASVKAKALLDQEGRDDLALRMCKVLRSTSSTPSKSRASPSTTRTPPAHAPAAIHSTDSVLHFVQYWAAVRRRYEHTRN